MVYTRIDIRITDSVCGVNVLKSTFENVHNLGFSQWQQHSFVQGFEESSSAAAAHPVCWPKSDESAPATNYRYELMIMIV